MVTCICPALLVTPLTAAQVALAPSEGVPSRMKPVAEAAQLIVRLVPETEVAMLGELLVELPDAPAAKDAWTWEGVIAPV